MHIPDNTFKRYVFGGKKSPLKEVDFFCYKILEVTSDPKKRSVNNPTLTNKSISSAGKIQPHIKLNSYLCIAKQYTKRTKETRQLQGQTERDEFTNDHCFGKTEQCSGRSKENKTVSFH